MFVSKKKREQRRDICKGCEHVHHKGQIPFTDKTVSEKERQWLPLQCGVCSCMIFAKTLFKDEKCPKGKW